MTPSASRQEESIRHASAESTNFRRIGVNGKLREATLHAELCSKQEHDLFVALDGFLCLELSRGVDFSGLSEQDLQNIELSLSCHFFRTSRH